MRSFLLGTMLAGAFVSHFFINYRSPLFPSKKVFISSEHSSSKIPLETLVFGCSKWAPIIEKPLFGSPAPYTTLPI